MRKPGHSQEVRPKETILVIDDDESVRRSLVWTLNADYRVLEAACRTDAVKLMQHESVDVVVSDLHLPPRLEDISEHGLIDPGRPVKVVAVSNNRPTVRAV